VCEMETWVRLLVNAGTVFFLCLVGARRELCACRGRGTQALVRPQPNRQRWTHREHCARVQTAAAVQREGISGAVVGAHVKCAPVGSCMDGSSEFDKQTKQFNGVAELVGVHGTRSPRLPLNERTAARLWLVVALTPCAQVACSPRCLPAHEVRRSRLLCVSSRGTENFSFANFELHVGCWNRMIETD